MDKDFTPAERQQLTTLTNRWNTLSRLEKLSAPEVILEKQRCLVRRSVRAIAGPVSLLKALVYFRKSGVIQASVPDAAQPADNGGHEPDD